MISRIPFYILVGVLLLTGIVWMAHRHFSQDVPWLPGATRTIWAVEAKVEFLAEGKPVKVTLTRPQNPPGFILLGENGASPGYGLSFVSQQNTPVAIWSIRQAEGEQQLFYRADLLVDPDAPGMSATPVPEPLPVIWQQPFETAAQQVLASAFERSADHFTLTLELLKELRASELSQNSRLLLTGEPDLAELVVKLLNQANVPARVVKALQLEDGRRRQELISLIQVWQDNHIQVFDPASGTQGLPPDMLLWEQQGQPVLDVIGGRHSKVTFSFIKRQEPVSIALTQQYAGSDLFAFSIYSLPLEEQAMFKTILLLPIGALVVVILRILVGLKTSGTFMPVLIALAFIQTSLVTGLVGFLMVVGTGLVFRAYLSRLNLLLVARISAVIITVVAIIGLFSILSYRLGLTEGLKITFFPMIILSWTIERMSILWEEEGPHEVLIQGGGSLLVAVCAYLAMDNGYVRHLAFNFIGLQLVLMALILMIGSYTGYRLLELKRFHPLSKD